MIIFLALGFVSSVLQIVLLRELTFSVAKNELALTAAAGLWLIFCAFGGIAGKKFSRINLSFISPLFTLIFCLSISVIHLGKSIFGISYYESCGIIFMLFFAVIAMFGTSFLTGYSFSVLTGKYADKNVYDGRIFARFFALDAIGFFLGGITFAFFLSKYLNPFIFAFLPLLIVPFFSKTYKDLLKTACLILFLSFTFIGNFGNMLSKELMYAEIIMMKASNYGPVIKARKNNVDSLYVSGTLASTSEDKEWDETFIHTFLSVIDPGVKKDVLFIGSCFPGQAEEIFRHNVGRVYSVDSDPVLLNFNQENIDPVMRDKMNFIADDPRSYLRRTDEGDFDCIVINKPPPLSVATNRYYTKEFFELVKHKLSPGGIMVMCIPSKRDILSPVIIKFNSCIINTVDNVYNSRMIVPSDSMIIIAKNMNGIKTYDIAQNFENSAIQTDYLTVYHLMDNLDSSRIEYVNSMIDKKININKDLFPAGFFYYFILEQTKFYPDIPIGLVKRVNGMMTIPAGVAFVFLYGIFIKKNRLMFLNVSAVGFLSIGFSIILYMVFQTFFGTLFWKIGILSGLFMCGLAAGTFFGDKIFDSKDLGAKVFCLYFSAWVLFVALIYLTAVFFGFNDVAEYAFYLCATLSGTLTGAVYPIASRVSLKYGTPRNVIASSIYTYDLVGAFIGTVMFSILFIPFYGILTSLAIMIFVGLIFAIRNGTNG
ncbi:MAG: hypothetical protein HQL29_02755 [Candidatus Omnitrophica bacterium]|nr:hypothetical protein [Candidatus Omnitrophota bacterium]